jgi:hypothetical protein
LGNSRKRLLRSVFTPPFILAATMLIGSALLAGPVASVLGYTRIKKRLELKAELHTLDVSKLAPYALYNAQTGGGKQILPPEVIDALGTEQYLSWMLEDTSVPQNDPLRNAQLDVTYYSGGHHIVPHTPDHCRRGAGYNPVSLDNVELIVPGVGLDDDRLPARACTFGKTEVFKRERVEVIYTFYCNGRFVATRDGVRLLLNDPSHRHAFFSKVEVSFPRANRDQNIRGAEKLLACVLPVLIEDHWPDFEAAERAAAGRNAG